MQPIRQILYDAPDSVQIPLELRHRPIELIIWPLDAGDGVNTQPDSEQTPAETPLMSKPEDRAMRIAPRFSIAQVDHIDIPSREERNARR